jgi:GTP cyclohydrolase I
MDICLQALARRQLADHHERPLPQAVAAQQRSNAMSTDTNPEPNDYFDDDAGANVPYAEADRSQIAEAVQTVLRCIGEDPERQGLQRTPQRIARMYEEILAGYHMDVDELLNGAMFDVPYDEVIVVKDIEFFSLCEHHMLPFFGFAHVAYIPRERVVGLSKLPRIVEMFARRLQVQERLTQEIADTISHKLNPWGVAVVIEASHMCAMMRGVKKEHSRMVTSAMRGAFKNNIKTRNEFLAIINQGRAPNTIF